MQWCCAGASRGDGRPARGGGGGASSALASVPVLGPPLAYLAGTPQGSNGHGSSTRAADVLRGADLDRKVVVLTGGTGSIGRALLRALLGRGARVVLGCRDVAVGSQLAAEEQYRRGSRPGAGGSLTVERLDLASAASVRAFAERLRVHGLPIHALVHCAGVFPGPFALSPDGFEARLAVNHLGPFLLTSLLLPTLAATAHASGEPSRVVHVCSGMHYFAYRDRKTIWTRGVNYHKLDSSYNYSPVEAYGTSKLCVLMYTRELRRRLHELGAPVVAVAADPGPTGREVRALASWVPEALSTGGPFFKTDEQAAATIAYCLVSPEVTSSPTAPAYYANCQPAPSSKPSQDEASARELWDACEGLMDCRGLGALQADDGCGVAPDPINAH